MCSYNHAAFTRYFKYIPLPFILKLLDFTAIYVFTLLFLFLAVLGLSCCSLVATLWLNCPMARGIFQDQGVELVFLALTGRFLTAGPPGKSPSSFLQLH